MAKINFQNMNSMVGLDATVNGNIKLDEGIIIYGTVFGTIETNGAVRISRSGKVRGDIVCSDIHIGGVVEGNVVVENRAVLGDASNLDGDLTYKTLIIEEGAQFQGQCMILGTDQLIQQNTIKETDPAGDSLSVNE